MSYRYIIYIKLKVFSSAFRIYKYHFCSIYSYWEIGDFLIETRGCYANFPICSWKTRTFDIGLQLWPFPFAARAVHFFIWGIFHECIIGMVEFILGLRGAYNFMVSIYKQFSSARGMQMRLYNKSNLNTSLRDEKRIRCSGWSPGKRISPLI